MSEEFAGASADLKAWMLLHRTRDLAFRCEDRVVGEFGLTAEQYTTLLAMKCLDDPIRPTDIGQWVGHKVNTVSMMVDRMVKAGLVGRVRDLPDRREVRLVITKKGEQAFKPATAAACQLMKQILSPLTHEDKLTLIRLLDMLREKALEPAGPEVDIRERETCETRDTADMMKRLREYVSVSTADAKPQRGQKRKR